MIILRRAACVGLMVVVCLAGTGCSTRPGPGPIPFVPVLDLSHIPQHVKVAGHALRLKVDLWRTFLPGFGEPPEGGPLMAAMQVETADGSALPPGLTLDAVLVINGNEVWEPPQLESAPQGDGTGMRLLAGDGPEWMPGSEAQVVVLLRDVEGTMYRLRASELPVTAVY